MLKAATAAAAVMLMSGGVSAFSNICQHRGVEVATGVFGAHMEVELVNDGPVTIVLDV